MSLKALNGLTAYAAGQGMTDYQEFLKVRKRSQVEAGDLGLQVLPVPGVGRALNSSNDMVQANRELHRFAAVDVE